MPGAGLDPATFTLVEGVDGGQQLKAGKWPLYRFAGDSAPGDINGQGSGDVWFAVAADGKLIKLQVRRSVLATIMGLRSRHAEA